jgi:poly-gamma-glutamate synthesis protein (capsule biosynthesis protein)
MRWGTEYSPTINGLQSQIAQKLADWGADVVLGHGPHVLQPVKQLTGQNGRPTLVWFSIGNFLNAQIPVESLVSGLAIMDIDLATKKVQPPAYLPIYMHYEWTADEKAREDLLKRHSFTMVPLDQAASLLSRSQNNTTVEAQTNRVTTLLNQFIPVKMVTSKTY